MTRYYDIDEATLRLQDLAPVLEGLRGDRDRLAELQAELIALRQTNGSASHAEEFRRREGEIAGLVKRMEAAVGEIDAWGITLRDIGSGLVDFPALANGRPIWLCWRLGESGIGFWHETNEGFGSRKPLHELT